MTDPFATLGLPSTASLSEIRAARRRLALEHHPDHGGNGATMGEVNRAFDLAVKTLLRPPERAVPRQRFSGRRRRIEHDTASFTIDALPAEAFEALVVVASWIGEVLVDDPPYMLDVHLYEPAHCWCRLELLPEAGSSMVSITVASDGINPPPELDDIRDLWVSRLNQLGPT